MLVGSEPRRERWSSLTQLPQRPCVSGPRPRLARRTHEDSPDLSGQDPASHELLGLPCRKVPGRPTADVPLEHDEALLAKRPREPAMPAEQF
eukprot:1801874-Pyramimonas_sp.AAC.1